MSYFMHSDFLMLNTALGKKNKLAGKAFAYLSGFIWVYVVKESLFRDETLYFVSQL